MNHTVHFMKHRNYLENLLQDHHQLPLKFTMTIQKVDILVSENQALQVLYLKHIKLHKLPRIETHKNLNPTKLNYNIAQYYCYITIVNRNIPYNWLAGSQLVPYALFN